MANKTQARHRVFFISFGLVLFLAGWQLSSWDHRRSNQTAAFEIGGWSLRVVRGRLVHQLFPQFDPTFDEYQRDREVQTLSHRVMGR